MSGTATYYTNQELPGRPYDIQDYDGDTLDLSSGWTASVVVAYQGAIVVTQTDNLTFAATAPNLTRTRWSAATLTAIAATLSTANPSRTFELLTTVRRTSDSADEVLFSAKPETVTFKLAPT